MESTTLLSPPNERYALSRLPPTSSLVPFAPNAHGLHLLGEIRGAHQILHLFPRLTREQRRVVRERPCDGGGHRRVQSQLLRVALVEGVGPRVVVGTVCRRFLVCDEVGDAV